MFYIFSSVGLQLSQALEGYKKGINAYCKANNIDLVNIASTLLTVIEIAEFMRGAPLPTSKMLINGALTLANKVTDTAPDTNHETTSKAAKIATDLAHGVIQVASFLAAKAGPVVLESLHRLHDDLLANDAASAWHSNDHASVVDDPENDFVVIELASRDVITVDDPGNSFVIVELMGSDPSYF